jgi:hypothetical protein
MTDAPKNERPWFQFHLSTAVLMMFAAAGLLYPNVVPRIHSTNVSAYGWPLTVYVDAANLPPNVVVPVFGQSPAFGNHELDWCHCYLNLLFIALTLFAVAYFCEWRIRRRERRP